MANPIFAPTGFGVAKTPWQAVQQAAWETVRRPSERLGKDGE